VCRALEFEAQAVAEADDQTFVVTRQCGCVAQHVGDGRKTLAPGGAPAERLAGCHHLVVGQLAASLSEWDV